MNLRLLQEIQCVFNGKFQKKIFIAYDNEKS